jgi:RNA polymerase sigma-70 factor (ECF subfamily)
MSSPLESDVPSSSPRQVGFATTHWSIVLAAGHRATPSARQALEDLCSAYWSPLYAYVRRRVEHVHEAQDLTQAFFAQLLEKDYLALATPQRGRFRAFLLTACKHFLSKEWEKARAQKRGGGRAPIPLDFNAYDSHHALEPSTSLTAEQLFDREWAITLLNRVLDRLRSEMVEGGKDRQFEELKNCISGDDGDSYDAIGQRLGISIAAVKMSVYRLRRHYRELLRDEISQTVPSTAEIEDEIRSLFATFES